MHELCSTAALPCDPPLLWAAQGLTGASRARAWVSGDGRAFAVAVPDLSRHDRLAVSGPVGSLAPLVAEVLAETGPSYRPLGDEATVRALVEALPELRPVATFGWMSRTRPLSSAEAGAADEGKARWLADDDAEEITALLAEAFPGSYAVPGAPGVGRWAGTRDDAGRLTSVAALAWSSPEVGLLAGVAVHPSARGRGLARTVVAKVLAEALAVHGTAALMVDGANDGAIRLYEGLGFAYRRFLAAELTPDI
ncbi:MULTISPECIES: GNAT family N-acetyltransferase [unclassified Streptomyces]|uniref:GNAT family N-acetyltransferase n=1 Tax=Streptomyces sp. NBC_00060 TaxID=2975636 RepID=A0AAU2H1I4_9ACTN